MTLREIVIFTLYVAIPLMLLACGIDIAISVLRERRKQRAHDIATFTGERFDWEP